jgi:hypothetical protein
VVQRTVAAALHLPVVAEVDALPVEQDALHWLEELAFRPILSQVRGQALRSPSPQHRRGGQTNLCPHHRKRGQTKPTSRGKRGFLLTLPQVLRP